MGAHAPDVNDPQALINFFKVIEELNQEGKLMAYHDRSDGGLLATVCEMAFAGQAGITIRLDDLAKTPLEALFTEELGAVIQVHHTDTEEVLSALREADLGHYSHVIGKPNLNKADSNEPDQILHRPGRMNRSIRNLALVCTRFGQKPAIECKPYAIMINARNRSLSASTAFVDPG